MTKKIVTLGILMMMGTVSLLAESKIEKFKVNGNCNMCENRIETAANSVEGVQAADWDQRTNMMTVSIDESKANLTMVQMAIAKAGHDAGIHRAKDEVYRKLHGCCKYERAKAEKEPTKVPASAPERHGGHNH